jgi:hypothetical protein
MLIVEKKNLSVEFLLFTFLCWRIIRNTNKKFWVTGGPNIGTKVCDAESK